MFEFEFENQEFYDENEGLDISRYDFNSFKIERSIRDLLSWEERKKIKIPSFQRNFVWTYNQCCKFIESILLNLPIPNLFVFREKSLESEQFLLLDGLQRFTCIKQFKSGTFEQDGKTRPFVINIRDSKWNKVNYKNLSEEDSALFNDYSIILNVLEPVDNSEDIKKLFMTELFERINTGSLKLNDQEIRNAVYAGKVIDQINVLVKECWPSTMTLSSDTSRFTNEEFVLRVLTYYNIYKRTKINADTICDYDGTNLKKMKITASKRNMLSQYALFSNKGLTSFDKDYQLLKRTLESLQSYPSDLLYGGSPDGKLTNKTHEVLAEAVIISMMDGKDLVIDVDAFNLFKIDYWSKTELNDNLFYTHTTEPGNVVKRIDLVKSHLVH